MSRKHLVENAIDIECRVIDVKKSVFPKTLTSFIFAFVTALIFLLVLKKIDIEYFSTPNFLIKNKVHFSDESAIAKPASLATGITSNSKQGIGESPFKKPLILVTDDLPKFDPPKNTKQSAKPPDKPVSNANGNLSNQLGDETSSIKIDLQFKKGISEFAIGGSSEAGTQ